MSRETSTQKIEFLGVDIQPGASVSLKFDVAKLHTQNRISVPVFIERAKQDGPVLLLLAGVHGDEVNGIEIVRRVIRNKINKPTAGTVICIPVFNIFGFLNLSRKFPDGRDLNRVFPGAENGSLASQFAYQFRKEIAPKVDYIVDFHSGGADRVNIAQVRCEINDERTFAMAKAFGAPFIVHSKTISKSIRETFKKLDKPMILFEGGKSLMFDEEAIENGVIGVKNIMRNLKMRRWAISEEVESIVIKNSKWVRASISGMFLSYAQNGAWVTKKTVMGIITDPFGAFEKKVLAPFDCYVFCVNISPVVNKGDAIFHISTELSDQNEIATAITE